MDMGRSRLARGIKDTVHYTNVRMEKQGGGKGIRCDHSFCNIHGRDEYRSTVGGGPICAGTGIGGNFRDWRSTCEACMVCGH